MPSTAIRNLSYEVDRRELTVTFVSGRRYRYYDVTPEVYIAFAKAPSRGVFFNEQVRDRYVYAELTLPSDGDR